MDKRDILQNSINDTDVIMCHTSMILCNEPFVPTIDYGVPEGVMGLTKVSTLCIYNKLSGI